MEFLRSDVGAVHPLIRSPKLERPEAEFSGFAWGDGPVTPPDFISMIGSLLPTAPCGLGSWHCSGDEVSSRAISVKIEWGVGLPNTTSSYAKEILGRGNRQAILDAKRPICLVSSSNYPRR